MTQLLMNPKLFPTLILALQVLALLSNMANGDIRRAIYWAGACVVVAAMTY